MNDEILISPKRRFTPVQVLALGFAGVILLGAIILTLPISSTSGKSTPFLTALFTSTSATCVTGLVVVDTGTYWSVFGQVTIMILIQIGGLGFMSFATIAALLVGKKITLRERLVMRESLNTFSIQGLVKLARRAIITTFVIEGIGAILLSIRFIKDYGLKGIYLGVFHSISAYCNAGFDIIGNYQNMVPYCGSIIVNVTIMSLIIIGGIGFIVQSDIYEHRHFKKFSFHTKIVLVTTLCLIIFGALMFFILEYNNPGTMKSFSIKDKILASFFASVTPRTAGFNTIDTTKMTLPSNLLTIILMYIGASPGSTGGGIKTSTFAVIVMTIISILKGRRSTEIHKKRIPKEVVYKSLAIIGLSITIIIIDIMILSITEKNAQLVQIMYETVSAFGTVGLSLGFSPTLTPIGRIVIILTMYAGRVGPLTIALAVGQMQHRYKGTLRYPEGKVIVG